MPLSAADRAAILNLAARYSHTIDLGDPDGFADCFTADGVFELPNRKTQGREALHAMAAAVPLQTVRHLPSTFAVEGDGREATMTCYVTVLRLGDTRETIFVGRYEDRLQKLGDDWKFTHRRVLVDWSGPAIALSQPAAEAAR